MLQLDERLTIDLVGARHRQLAIGDRPDRRCPPPAFEGGALAVQRARPVLGHPLAVDLDPHHAVEHEEELVGGRPLLGDRAALLHVADAGLGRALHQLHRQLPLQGRLDLGRECRRVAVAPRAVLAEGPPVPGGEVDQPALRGELAVTAVDPVPRERARAGELVGRGSVGPEREREGGPGEWRGDLDEGRASDPPGRGHTGPAAARLDERDRMAGRGHVRVEVGERDRLEDRLAAADLQGGRSDLAAAGLTEVDDPPVLDLDPGSQLVREAKAVGPAQLVEVVDHVGRRLVVVRNPDLERELGREAVDRL